MDRMDSYSKYSNCDIESMDSNTYRIDTNLDVLDLLLAQYDIWDYIVSTPQFELYLQAMIEEEKLDWSMEEAKRYIEGDGWDVLKDFVAENKDIQEALNKNLTIDFNNSRFKLSKKDLK